jgi:dihydrofolate synthase / folylpolyglutamate synthase
MRYPEALAYLYGLAPRGVSLGLGRMRRALALRGHPEKAAPAVLVAGTNGKGSVASMVASVLSASGLRVGLYTSPHLHRVVERFRVDGRAMPEAAFARGVTALARAFATPGFPELTFFEACTLLAFEHFRARRCDVVVLEVGLGGRLDATNVVAPEVSVITSIDLDHTDRLGSTHAAIAREKAGILHRGALLVRGPMLPEAARVIDRRAQRLGCARLRVGHELAVESAAGRHEVRVHDARYAGLASPLRGAYQAHNLACAVAALHALSERGFALGPGVLKRGLAKTRWPGRLELFTGPPDVLCDAAHNPHAARALAEHLAALAPRYTRVVALFGAMHDKQHAEMVAPLAPHVAAWVFATPDTPRAAPAEQLARRFGGEAVAQPERAFRRAQQRAGRRGLVLVCGSIFLMAPIRALLAGERQDPPIAM